MASSKMAASSSSLVLALNAGSSSLKASVIRGEDTIVSFLAERLLTPQAQVTVTTTTKAPAEAEATKVLASADADASYASNKNMMNHSDALLTIVDYLKCNDNMLASIVAVGHRVVHGGTKFVQSTLIDDDDDDNSDNSIIKEIESISHLAPLHNPHNVNGIKLMKEIMKKQQVHENEENGTSTSSKSSNGNRTIPNVAVFDTSFHSTIPQKAYTYPIPYEYRLQDPNIRKFGFHGTSVHYITQKATSILNNELGVNDGDDTTTNYQLIVCHLGNGASITAVSNGQSVETSMGFTPLSGLMMGTRCGSIDPSIVGYACERFHKTVDEVLTDLNKHSGLKGIIGDGGDYDMRSLLEKSSNGDADATLAIDMFVYRVCQYIAMNCIALSGPVDAIIFTAGIGEHSSYIRQRVIQQLQQTVLPTLSLDNERNEQHGKYSNCIISSTSKPTTPSSIKSPYLLAIPTNEEVMIAKECIRLLEEKN